MRQIVLGFWETQDRYTGEQIMLCLHEDGTTTIRHEGWWPKSGGSGENKMDSDYFRTHTMEEFISFLTQQHRNEHSPHKWDFSSLANREEILALFRKDS